MKLIILIACIFVAILLNRNLETDWYRRKDYYPPDYLFPIIWAIIYSSYIFIFYLTQSSIIFYLYIITLFLQTIWTKTFNKHSALYSKLLISLLTLISFLITYYSFKINIFAGYISLIYLLWISYANFININIEAKTPSQ